MGAGEPRHPRFIAGVAEHPVGLREFEFATAVCAGEVKVLVAAFPPARDGGSLLTAKDALLMNKFVLLLVKIQNLPIVDIEALVGPKTAACMNVNV